MAKASAEARLREAVLEALRARFEVWYADRVAEDRAESAVLPEEFRILCKHDREIWPNGRPGA